MESQNLASAGGKTATPFVPYDPSRCLTDEELWQNAGGHLRDPRIQEHLAACEDCRMRQQYVPQG